MGLLDELKDEIEQRKREASARRLTSSIAESKQQLEKLDELQQHIERQHKVVEEVTVAVGALRKEAEGLGIPDEKFAAAELEMLKEQGSTPEQQEAARIALAAAQATIQDIFDELDTLVYQGYDVRGELDRAGLKQVWTPALRIIDWENKASLFLTDPTKWSQQERNEIFAGLAAQWRSNHDDGCISTSDFRERLVNLAKTFDLERSYDFHPGKPGSSKGQRLALMARAAALLALADTRLSGGYRRPTANKQVYGEAVQAKSASKKQDAGVSALLNTLDAATPATRVGTVAAWCESNGRRVLSEQDTREIVRRLGDSVGSLKNTWLWQAVTNLPERLYAQNMAELRGKVVALFAMEVPESMLAALKTLGVAEVRVCSVDAQGETIDAAAQGADYAFIWIGRCSHSVTSRVGERAKNTRTALGSVSLLSALKAVKGE